MQPALPYFEVQGSLSRNCALHAINNIIGEKRFSKDNLNEICQQLDSESIINPHKHMLGGDYDANVLIIALQNTGYNVEWHDNRLPISLRFLEEQGNFAGLIINSKHQQNVFSKMIGLSGRHWIAVRKYENLYFLLDSQEKTPSLLGKIEHAEDWVNSTKIKGTEILAVYHNRV